MIQLITIVSSVFFLSTYIELPVGTETKHKHTYAAVDAFQIPCKAMIVDHNLVLPQPQTFSQVVLVKFGARPHVLSHGIVHRMIVDTESFSNGKNRVHDVAKTCTTRAEKMFDGSPVHLVLDQVQSHYDRPD